MCDIFKLIILFTLILFFISYIFIRKINRKIVKNFLTLLTGILFSYITFEVIPLLFLYNNLYMTIGFILLGIIIFEYLDIMCRCKEKFKRIDDTFLFKEFLYFFSQGAIIKFVLDVQYSVGLNLLIIFCIYDFFRIVNKDIKKFKIFLITITIFLGSLMSELFFSIHFIFIGILEGITLCVLSDEITFYLGQNLNQKFKNIVLSFIGVLIGLLINSINFK